MRAIQRGEVQIKPYCILLLFLFIFAVFCLSAEPGFSQDLQISAGGGEGSGISANREDDTAKKIVRYGLFYGTVPVVFLFGVKAWDWSGDHSFYSRREGWFAKDTDYAGADKAGHFYAHYVVQRSLYDIFNWTENGGNMKWAYSIGTTMGVGFLIELGDGFSSKYGFSYEDLVMDYTGILCGAVLERFPVADGFIGISSHYSPTSVFSTGMIHIAVQNRFLNL